MTREKKEAKIREWLATLAFRVQFDNYLCRYDVNHASESVYASILNAFFGWSLKNANDNKANESGIDLEGTDAQGQSICVQVSSDCSKKKVEHSLEESKNRTGSHFYFVSLVREPPGRWTTTTFAPPKGLTFVCPDDIYSPKRLIRECANLSDADLDKVYDACRREFADDSDVNVDEGLSVADIKENIQLVTAAFGDLFWEERRIVDLCRGYENQVVRFAQIRHHLLNQLKNGLAPYFNAIIDLKARLFTSEELYRMVCEMEAVYEEIDDCVNVGSDFHGGEVAFVAKCKEVLTAHTKIIMRLLEALAKRTRCPENVYDMFLSMA